MLAVLIMVCAGLVGSTSLPENASGGTSVKGEINGTVIWDVTGSPYVMTGTLTVGVEGHLIIDPGVQVFYDGDNPMFVDGVLSAVGTETERVTFRSNPPSRGYMEWTAIQVSAKGRAHIENADMNYSGNAILLRSSSNVIRDSTILSGTYNYGISLESATGNVIDNNTLVHLGLKMSGDTVEHYRGNQISDTNTVNGKPLYHFKDCNGINVNGIQVGQLVISNCTNVQMRNLQVSEGGIVLAYSSNAIIDNNTVSSSRYGIHLYNSVNCTVTSNNISGIGAIGIYLQSSSWMLVKYNSIRNSLLGIGIAASSSNVISFNHVESVNYGIIVLSSENQWAYSNTIESAFYVEGADSSTGTKWNASYPIGGNYWSSYSPVCQDLYSGAATPQTGGAPDGICDVPYQVDQNTVDYYPVTAIVVGSPPPKTDFAVAQPGNLSAQLSGLMGENMMVTWGLSADDPFLGAGENDVVAYNIYYSRSFDAGGDGYLLLDSVPAGTATYTHYDAGAFGTYSYFYYVEAVDDDGNKMETAQQVRKWTMHLEEGLNLVSLPIIPSGLSVLTMLQWSKINAIWYYNGSEVDDHWKCFNPSKPVYDLGVLNHRIGLLVDMKEGASLALAGTVPKTTSIQLKTGWNLVGYPAFSEISVANAFGGVPYERIEGYSANPGQGAKVMGDADLLYPGYGYWIKVPSDVTWDVTF